MSAKPKPELETKMNNKVALCALAFVLFWPSITVAGPLTNDDIVKMLEAGLPQSTILMSIRGGETQFDTSADGLIRLNSSGVPAPIIEAMIAAGNGHSVGQQEMGKETLPSEYGLYVPSEGLLDAIPRSRVQEVFGLKLVGSGGGYGVDGFRQPETPVLTAESATEFIIFDHDVDPTVMRLSKLIRVDSMTARQFNIGKKNEAWFDRLFNVSPDAVIKVDLLRASSTTGLRVAPVANQTDMYKLLPPEALEPGTWYALHAAGAVHGANIVYAAPTNDPPRYGFVFKTSGKNAEERIEEELTISLDEYISGDLIAKPGADTRFIDQKTGIGFLYPTDFEVLDGQVPPVVAVLFASASNRDFAMPHITVTNSETPAFQKNPPVEKIVANTLTNVRQGMVDAITAGPKTTVVAGYDARVFFVQGKENGVLKRKAVTIGVGEERIMGVVLHATPSSFGDYLGVYKKVCDTYSLP